jgi:hypothetical protein
MNDALSDKTRMVFDDVWVVQLFQNLHLLQRCLLLLLAHVVHAYLLEHLRLTIVNDLVGFVIGVPYTQCRMTLCPALPELYSRHQISFIKATLTNP